jgi:hypothetical protein
MPSVPVSWWVASVVMGAVAAVIYTLSPLAVVTAAIVPVLLWAAAAGLPRHEAKTLWALMGAAIAVRVLTILVMLLAADHDTQAAAILTGDEAYALSRTLRVRNFLLGIPGLKYDYFIAFESYGRTSYLSFMTLLQMLFGPSPYGLRLVNMLLFLAGAAVLFRFARAAFGHTVAFAALTGILFLPTLFFWSVSLLKESLYFALSAGVLGGVYAVIRAPHTVPRIAAGVGVAAALWALRDMRPGAVYLVGGGAAIGVLAFVATASMRRFAIAIVLAVIAAGLLLTRPTVRDRVVNAIDQAAQIQLGHVFTAGHSYKTLDEEFYVTWTPDTRLTTGEAARFVIRSIRSFLIEPWPWRMATRSELLFLPEHLLWYTALLLSAAGIAGGLRRDRLATCLLVGIILPTAFVVAMTNGNVGTLIRFRGLVWPYVLVLAVAGVRALMPDVEKLSAVSASGRLVGRAGGAWSAAVGQSRALSSWRAFAARARRLDIREQFRSIGIALASFVVIHLALLQAVPLSAAPVMPILVWLIAAALAGLLTAGAAALARAWHTHPLRRG